MKMPVRNLLRFVLLALLFGCGDGGLGATGIIGTWARSGTREYDCTDPSYDQPNEVPVCVGGGPCPTYVFTDKGFTYTDPRNGYSKSGTYTYSNDHLALTDPTGMVEFRVALTPGTLSFFTTATKNAVVSCISETKYSRR